MSGGEQTLLEVAGRMTSRDRWMFAMLHEHRVLTRHQLTRLAFTGDRMTRLRLATLTRLQTVDRLRPYYGQGRGTGPYHYALGPLGAAILAAERGLAVAELGYRRDKLHAWANSPRLGHLIGVNAVFTAWVHASRTRPDHEGLTAWWSEQRAHAEWGRWIRPDGYGTWQAGRRRLDFFVEFDTGSESLSQVVRKIPGYTRLAASSGLTSPVLIWLPSAYRERELRARLAAIPSGVVLVTAAPAPLTAAAPAHDPPDLAPARGVWLPLHATTRTDLDGLTTRYGTPILSRSPFDDPDPTDDDEHDPAPTPRPPAPSFGPRSPLGPA
ncbi:hypothetical protein CC117_25820 [Parafrankia colletiae]|uniref:Protein involved in plasmid replication-relaxation n=1 Tax=Parafrankia colletiae TaxID=573497 RepID=A0A1S1QEH9_9ACTN|nr:replication-relaxation family protein [Parafrankia colletiae]MCK9903609.1 replication-relaxation family protein [Frankia sp. Cpl3]OHV31635.1 hypothetical protein CC117_25820 [Parafrankia colletiae]